MNFIKKLLLPIAQRHWASLLLEPEKRKVLKYIYQDKSQERMRSDIVMRVHTIEKGLSLKDVRPGFGVPKIIAILKLTEKYYRLFQDATLVVFVTSIIDEYIAFNKTRGEVNDDIVKRQEALKGKISEQAFSQNPVLHGGTLHFRKSDIQKAAHGEFPEFCAARHSIRSFTGKPVDVELIQKAFTLAESTPSACNRQPWAVWATMKKEEIIKVLELQTGARQFKEDVACVIVVSARMTAFTSTEYHQAYVNGGMYAMNLLYALHYVGLGAIPLNLGVKEEQLNTIYNFCGIEESNLPIMMIAVGDMEEEFKVAHSCRFPYKNYVTFHQP